MDLSQLLSKKLIKYILIIVGVFWFVYYSSIYLSLFSQRLSLGEGYYKGDGFHIVSYPTHKRIFYSTHIPDGSLPETFAMRSQFIRSADPDTFEALSAHFGKDKNTIYSAFGFNPVFEIPVEGEVKVISNAYIMNGDSVYFKNRKIEGAHASDFVFLDQPDVYSELTDHRFIFDSRFARSGDTIYYGDKLVTAWQDGAFTISPNSLIPCNAQVLQTTTTFVKCKITPDGKSQQVSIDAPTFTVLEPNDLFGLYAKDKNHVYYAKREGGGSGCGETCGVLHVVEGADSSTFMPGIIAGKRDARDSAFEYVNGCRIYPRELSLAPIRNLIGTDWECSYSSPSDFKTSLMWASLDTSWIETKSRQFTVSGTANTSFVNVSIADRGEVFWHSENPIPVTNGKWQTEIVVPSSVSNGKYHLIVSGSETGNGAVSEPYGAVLELKVK